jgi:acyl-CoA thioester hydrolase
MTHRFALRVYYEDTDLAGVVYYANYLKFIERGRSEWVRDMGVDQVALKAGGTVFAVRRVVADYLAPAKYDDQLVVQTDVQKIGGASLSLVQTVWRADTLLFSAVVVIVAIGADGKPVRLPANIRPR